VPERRAIDDCVHCGFCLPVCPTYVSWAAEADSPRGRIDLARAVADGQIRLEPAAVAHFDRCLGCMACLAACPSGVRYDEVIETARAAVEQARVRPLGDRLFRGLIFRLFPYPSRLRVAAFFLWLAQVTGLQWLVRTSGVLRLVSRRLAQLQALAPEVGWRSVAARLPALTPARGPRRGRVGLVGGCVQRVFFPGVNDATLRVLAAEGFEVVAPAGQGCCGALSIHSGRPEEAARLARALLERFEGLELDAVIVNAAGCGSHLKDLGQIFRADPALAARAQALSRKVRDVNEFLAGVPQVAPRGPYPSRVAYHSSCHLGHAQGISRQPRDLLRAIPGLELVEIANGDECCGSAGIYNLVEPESANEIGARKAESVLASKAPIVAAANPGCTLHIQKLLRERGAAVEAAHPIEILDASIRAARAR
jgi:glycolate oxidase iron-sulfur subunit